MKAEPKSPCISNCCLDIKDICMGCFRSLKEITAWSSATAEEKRAYIRLAEARRQSYQA